MVVSHFSSPSNVTFSESAVPDQLLVAARRTHHNCKYTYKYMYNYKYNYKPPVRHKTYKLPLWQLFPLSSNSPLKDGPELELSLAFCNIHL